MKGCLKLSSLDILFFRGDLVLEIDVTAGLGVR